jgi:hypothetical protein
MVLGGRHSGLRRVKTYARTLIGQVQRLAVFESVHPVRTVSFKVVPEVLNVEPYTS